MSEVRTMGRRVPGMAALLSPREQFLPLLLTELTPQITHLAHGTEISRNRLKAELQTTPASAPSRSPALFAQLPRVDWSSRCGIKKISTPWPPPRCGTHII